MAIDESATTEEQRRLAALRARASAELERIETTEALEDWRTRYLGRERGELTAVLKGLGKLPGEQRKVIGQAANEVKTELDALLEARRQALVARERAAALERETLDVTLPGRAIPARPSASALADDARYLPRHGADGLPALRRAGGRDRLLQLPGAQPPAGPSRARHAGHLLDRAGADPAAHADLAEPDSHHGAYARHRCAPS